MAAMSRDRSGVIRKITRHNLPWPEVLQLRKPKPNQTRVKILRREEGQPAFAQFGYALSPSLVFRTLLRWERGCGLPIIEYHVGAMGETRGEAEGGPNDLFGEVRDDAQPKKERSPGSMEAGGC